MRCGEVLLLQQQWPLIINLHRCFAPQAPRGDGTRWESEAPIHQLANISNTSPPPTPLAKYHPLPPKTLRVLTLPSPIWQKQKHPPILCPPWFSSPTRWQVWYLVGYLTDLTGSFPMFEFSDLVKNHQSCNSHQCWVAKSQRYWMWIVGFQRFGINLLKVDKNHHFTGIHL